MLHRLDETANAGAATGVSATAGNAAATVSWRSPQVSNGGSAITQYSVLSSPGGFSAVVSGSVLTVTVSGLTNGISYTFTVTAQNFLGSGPASAPSNAVTPTAPTPPGAPTNVSATPGNGSASVSWTAPSSDGGSAITQYTVTAAPGGITATSTTPSAIVFGLINGTTFTVTVTATNASGTGPSSTMSNPVTPTAPVTPPSAPNNVSAFGGPLPGNATVNWMAPSFDGGSAISSYTVTANTGQSQTVPGNSTSANFMGLPSGLNVSFTVHATNVAGNGPESAPSIFVMIP